MWHGLESPASSEHDANTPLETRIRLNDFEPPCTLVACRVWSQRGHEKAEQQAREILNKSSTNIHVMEDRGQSVNADEEALYGAVVKNKAATGAKNANSKSNNTTIGTNKKRVNETVNDDRKQTTNELKKFHRR